MQKKKLTALPIDKNREDVPVMQAVVEFQHTDLWGNNYTSNKYNYVYNAFLDTSTGENTLIVDVFSPAPDAKFCYRLLIGKNKQGNDKWFIIDSKGEVSERSLDGSCYYNKFYYPFSAETDKVIDDYLADTSSYAKGKGIEKIIAWQSAVRQKRLKDKYQKIKDSISYELAEIRPLPQAVHKWIDNTVMAYSRYMFYDANVKKQTTARCSVCGNEVTINKVRSGDKVTCPSCNKKCTAKPYKKYANSRGFIDRETIMYLQPFKGTRFCAREFIIEYYYDCGRINPYICIKELVEKSKQQGEQLALLGDELNDSNNAQKSLQADKQNLTDENKLLHKRIKELESKPVEVAVQEPTQAQIEAAAKSKINSLKASFEKEKQSAVEKAVKQATEKTKSNVKETLEKEYKAKFESIEKERQAALDKAKQLANRLDKNADAELVTATLYFNELQAQLDKFINSVEKICETNSAQGEKLKQIAQNFLSNTIANLN